MTAPAGSDPLLIGIEIGGTKLQVVRGTGDGTITRMVRRTIQPDRGASGILEQIAEAIPELVAPDERPLAVGVGFGGPVDSTRGVVTRSHQVEGWSGFGLADWVRQTWKVDRVAIQNDADTAGLGEARFGSGVGLSPVFYVTIGSGIGGGLIVDGQIYRGAGQGAAEIGHLWVSLDGDAPRHLEDVASGWAIGQEARRVLGSTAEPGPLRDFGQGDLSRVDARMVAQAARQGDPLAIRLLDRATRAMGQALGHVVSLLAPRRIILGGGVSLLEPELWIDPIRLEVERNAFAPFRGTFDVVSAKLGEEVVVHGALALARDLLRG